MVIKNEVIRETAMSLKYLLNSGLAGKNYFKIKKLHQKVSQDAVDFEETRINLCEKYADKKDGQPIMEEGNYIFGNNKEKFNEEWLKLIQDEQEYDFEPISIEEEPDVKINAYTEKFFKE